MRGEWHTRDRGDRAVAGRERQGRPAVSRQDSAEVVDAGLVRLGTQGRTVARFWRGRTTLLDVVQDLPNGVGVGDVRRRPPAITRNRPPHDGPNREPEQGDVDLEDTLESRCPGERSGRHAGGGCRRLMSGRTRMPVTVRVWPGLALCPAGDDVSSER